MVTLELCVCKYSLRYTPCPFFLRLLTPPKALFRAIHGIPAAGSESQQGIAKSRSPECSSRSNKRVCNSCKWRPYNGEYHLIKRFDGTGFSCICRSG